MGGVNLMSSFQRRDLPPQTIFDARNFIEENYDNIPEPEQVAKTNENISQNWSESSLGAAFSKIDQPAATPLGHGSANHVLTSLGRVAFHADSPRFPDWLASLRQTNETRSQVPD